MSPLHAEGEPIWAVSGEAIYCDITQRDVNESGLALALPA